MDSPVRRASSVLRRDDGVVGEFKSFLRKTPDYYHGPSDYDPADEAADAADWDDQND